MVDSKRESTTIENGRKQESTTIEKWRKQESTTITTCRCAEERRIGIPNLFVEEIKDEKNTQLQHLSDSSKPNISIYEK